MVDLQLYGLRKQGMTNSVSHPLFVYGYVEKPSRVFNTDEAVIIS